MIDQATRDLICERLAGDESLKAICSDPAMPSRETVRRHWDKDPEFEARCARARVVQADTIHDDMIGIEQRVADGELDARAASVILSSKQWRASKLGHKRYGDKLEHSGQVGVAVTLTPGETGVL
jgi:hypothetical protein